MSGLIAAVIGLAIVAGGFLALNAIIEGIATAIDEIGRWRWRRARRTKSKEQKCLRS
jgi:hypothetical protein